MPGTTGVKPVLRRGNALLALDLGRRSGSVGWICFAARLGWSRPRWRSVVWSGGPVKTHRRASCGCHGRLPRRSPPRSPLDLTVRRCWCSPPPWVGRSVGPISSGTASSQLSLPRTRQSPSRRRTGARPRCRTACASMTFGIPVPACSSPRARASRRCRRSWGHATASITLDTYGHLFPSEMEALADRLEMVRDAALAKRARTQHGPADNRLGEPAGG